jgi:tRNA (guanine37-N1)-methyltransferase
MKIVILTIFPELFDSFLSTSLITKALQNKKIELQTINIRDFSEAPHYKVDDTPYGGGAGMVFKPEPVLNAIKFAKKECPNAKVIYLSPSGVPYKQALAKQLSKDEQLILLCGRYEGIDQRVIDQAVDMELSIGDYVLMGGEIPAMVVIESITRLVDNVLGNTESLEIESFSESPEGLLLEAPQYTRPPVFNGQPVPEVLLSGNHKEIEKWRRQKSLEKTNLIRPDLIIKRQHG